MTSAAGRPRGAAGGEPAVRAWSAPVLLPTYPAPPPERSPMFLEKRVYQGSSGRVYPNPVTDRVSDRRIERSYEGVFLENEYVQLLILPEIGGRIHVGRDRTNGYDFFYRQRVIKPALVGLLGPWISGGVEFNWPQHHRPSTFMPVDWTIDRADDGSCTVWLSEHEPMTRMKGMVGVTLRPGTSVVEAQVRLYNRTPDVQTFLWWANVAVRVHDRYEVFFPQDVWYVADHAKRAMSYYPRSRGTYYGVDYGSRPDDAADLRWYRNIPVPTSYMAMGSRQDFFGGYDHLRSAGLVHVADHRIAPGKKLWTWGSHEFGQAWDRNLTDDDGPYVELMAGVYTDNQPDFSFLQPYETKSFRQYWYPIREIGPATLANTDAAVRLDTTAHEAHVGVHVTAAHAGARIVLERVEGDGRAGDGDGPHAGELARRVEALLDQRVDLAPDRPYLARVALPAGTVTTDLRLRVLTEDDRLIIEHVPEVPTPGALPAAASEPPAPGDIPTLEELWLTGLHLWQYRHATRSPEPYWREALRRDPGDVRNNTSLAAWQLQRVEPAHAERHLRAALARQTERNPNPPDGEPSYLLGRALRMQNRDEEAYDAFAKAAWNGAWAPAARHAMAEIDASRGRWEAALDQLDAALRGGADDLKARDLRAAALRHLARASEALAAAEATLQLDGLDAWAWLEREWATRDLPAGAVPGTGLTREDEAPEATRGPAGEGAARREAPRFDLLVYVDVAFDLAAAGCWDEAIVVLGVGASRAERDGTDDLFQYRLAWLCERAGRAGEAAEARRRARGVQRGASFAGRPEDVAVLGAALAAEPADARARYHLGNLFYDRRRHAEAIAAWEESAVLDPTEPMTWRNLGVAYFNVAHRPRRARRAYRRAFEADPTDARLLYEWDQLEKRLSAAPAERLARLERHRELVDRRDDLGAEYATLLSDVGRHADALAYLGSRRFHPWEGGEGVVSAAYVRAHLRLAQAALAAARPDEARQRLEAALHYPENLGEGRHLLTPQHDLHYHLALALEALGDQAGARRALELAADPRSSQEPPTEPVPVLSEATYWRARALHRLGRPAAARRLLRRLRDAARRAAGEETRIDYFATSLPTFLLFEDDLDLHHRAHSRFLEGLAELGLHAPKRARRAFEEALTLAPLHDGAAWGLRQLE